MTLTYDKHLIYKSRYRGMKELDIMFERFSPYIAGLSDVQKHQFDHLLDEAEADLYQWLVLGRAADVPYAPLVQMIRQAWSASV